MISWLLGPPLAKVDLDSRQYKICTPSPFYQYDAIKKLECIMQYDMSAVDHQKRENPLNSVSISGSCLMLEISERKLLN